MSSSVTPGWIKIDGKWHHIIVNEDGKVYVDGKHEPNVLTVVRVP